MSKPLQKPPLPVALTKELSTEQALVKDYQDEEIDRIIIRARTQRQTFSQIAIILQAKGYNLTPAQIHSHYSKALTRSYDRETKPQVAVSKILDSLEHLEDTLMGALQGEDDSTLVLPVFDRLLKIQNSKKELLVEKKATRTELEVKNTSDRSTWLSDFTSRLNQRQEGEAFEAKFRSAGGIESILLQEANATDDEETD